MTTEILGYMADPMAEEKAKQEHMKHMQKTMYFIRQKSMGIIAIIVGIIAIIISTEGIAASMLLIPYGIAMTVSKDKMITEEGNTYEE